MYLGYPIHGDMQGGAWNPVVWLLSLFGRYNVTSVHLEILISIFIAGAGMYRLLGVKNLSSSTRLIGAASYLMCGYITDVAGSNLPFLWAAAYAPFTLAYYYHFLQSPSIKNALKTAIALSLFFVSAYPSFFIITCYIMLAGFFVVVIKNILKKNKSTVKSILINNIYLGIAFLGISAVAIISYLHILPFYQRGGGVSLQQSFANSFHPSCSLSFILPSAPIKNGASFATDLISRNVYFNCLVLVFLLCYAWMKKTLFLNFTLAGIIFFFLFSLGDYTPLRALCYKLLPLMDTFRHPSNARLFVIIGSIVLGIIILEKFIQANNSTKIPQVISSVFLIAILFAVGLSIPNIELGARLKELSNGGEIRRALKNFFDKLSVNDLVFINGVIQAFFLIVLIFLLRKKTASLWFVALFLANSFLFAQLTIPYTLASKISPKTINTLLNNYPKDYPFPDKLESIKMNSFDMLANYETIGINGFYNKKIATTDVVFTPTFMAPVEKIILDSAAKVVVLSNSYAYFAMHISSVADNIQPLHSLITNNENLLRTNTFAAGDFELIKFWNNGFVFQTTTTDSAVFCLQQLYLPGWKCKIDGKEVKPAAANIAFMAVKIPPGNHKISFIYQPFNVIIGLMISVISCLAFIFLLIKITRKKNA